jgi:hypothetical protein
VSVGVPQAIPISYRYNYGETYYWKSYDNSYNGKVIAEGAEWTALGFINYGGTKYTSKDSNGKSTSQTTNTFRLGIPGLNLKYEDDHNALGDVFGWLPWIPKGSGDKYRTSAAQINIGLFSMGYNLMTGENTGSTHEFDGDTYWKEQNVHRLGLVYFGFGPMRFGYNSEKTRVKFQNDLIHRPKHLHLWDDLSKNPDYPQYHGTKFYWYFGSTGGSSLW